MVANRLAFCPAGSRRVDPRARAIQEVRSIGDQLARLLSEDTVGKATSSGQHLAGAASVVMSSQSFTKSLRSTVAEGFRRAILADQDAR
jgi:hypothetical protein